MSVRTRMLGFVDVILRVPPIFIIDEILKISMGLPFTTQNDSTLLDNNQITLVDASVSAASPSAAASAADSILLSNTNSSTITSSSFNNSNSSLEQFLNTTSDALFSDAISAVAADDTEFYKLISLTSLKFFSCLLGKCAYMYLCLYNVCVWERERNQYDIVIVSNSIDTFSFSVQRSFAFSVLFLDFVLFVYNMCVCPAHQNNTAHG